jgi:ABC-type spermidine/putrescine transport system permease subunit II
MTNPITSVLVGDINLFTEFLLLLFAIIVSMIGGAIGGIMLAGQEFGYRFSAMLGGLLAPAGVIPVVIVGLAILKIFIY